MGHCWILVPNTILGQKWLNNIWVMRDKLSTKVISRFNSKPWIHRKIELVLQYTKILKFINCSKCSTVLLWIFSCDSYFINVNSIIDKIIDISAFCIEWYWINLKLETKEISWRTGKISIPKNIIFELLHHFPKHFGHCKYHLYWH